MTALLSSPELDSLRAGYDAVPERSSSLHADCYTQARFLEIERATVFYRSWQFACHERKVAAPGSYFVMDVQGRSVAIVRDRAGDLRAFYNVCQHRAHALLIGDGTKRAITCPYHGWTYDLDGSLRAAPRTDHLKDFSTREIRILQVQIDQQTDRAVDRERYFTLAAHGPFNVRYDQGVEFRDYERILTGQFSIRLNPVKSPR